MKKNTERAGGEHKCLFAGGNSARGNSAGGSSARGSSANTGGRRRHRHRLHLIFQNAFVQNQCKYGNNNKSQEFCAAIICEQGFVESVDVLVSFVHDGLISDLSTLFCQKLGYSVLDYSVLDVLSGCSWNA